MVLNGFSSDCENASQLTLRKRLETTKNSLTQAKQIVTHKAKRFQAEVGVDIDIICKE